MKKQKIEKIKYSTQCLLTINKRVNISTKELKKTKNFKRIKHWKNNQKIQ